MSNVQSVHYFGKLRRRREFIKAAGSVQDYYYDWEVWFNKCSNANSLLPFLTNKNRVKPIWLFIISEAEMLKVGLTTLSSDMAERKHPFLVYFQNQLTYLASANSLLTNVLLVASKYEGFIKTIANGDFTADEEQYFASLTDSHKVTNQLQELLKCITIEIIERMDSHIMNSYWINLDNFSTIHHQGPLTCTLYNKIYG